MTGLDLERAQRRNPPPFIARHSVQDEQLANIRKGKPAPGLSYPSCLVRWFTFRSYIFVTFLLSSLFLIKKRRKSENGRNWFVCDGA